MGASSYGERWRKSALCAVEGWPTSIFFPATEDDPALAAKAVCLLCPVRDDCLEFAIRTGQADGVWGGLRARERRRHKRKTQAMARELRKESAA